MKTTILILILTLTSMFCATAQETYEYKYDGSGNRILRHIIHIKSASLLAQNDTIVESDSSLIKKARIYKEVLGKSNINVYPNPTRGNLKVELQKQPENSECSVVLYDMEGKQITQTKIDGSQGLLDISSYPNGMYIMRVFINTEYSEWKIIKE